MKLKSIFFLFLITPITCILSFSTHLMASSQLYLVANVDDGIARLELIETPDLDAEQIKKPMNQFFANNQPSRIVPFETTNKIYNLMKYFLLKRLKEVEQSFQSYLKVNGAYDSRYAKYRLAAEALEIAMENLGSKLLVDLDGFFKANDKIKSSISREAKRLFKSIDDLYPYRTFYFDLETNSLTQGRYLLRENHKKLTLTAADDKYPNKQKKRFDYPMHRIYELFQISQLETIFLKPAQIANNEQVFGTIEAAIKKQEAEEAYLAKYQNRIFNSKIDAVVNEILNRNHRIATQLSEKEMVQSLRKWLRYHFDRFEGTLKNEEAFLTIAENALIALRNQISDETYNDHPISLIDSWQKKIIRNSTGIQKDVDLSTQPKQGKKEFLKIIRHARDSYFTNAAIEKIVFAVLQKQLPKEQIIDEITQILHNLEFAKKLRIRALKIQQRHKARSTNSNLMTSKI